MFDVYTQCLNSGIKELHFVRCETDRIDWQRFVIMLKAQQARLDILFVSHKAFSHTAASSSLYSVPLQCLHVQIMISTDRKSPS